MAEGIDDTSSNLSPVSPITAPPLLIAHGLFGSARNWGVLARRLADTRDVIAVDMRNHGASPHAPSHSYPDLAGDLAEVIAQLGSPVGGVEHLPASIFHECPSRVLLAVNLHK